MKRERKAERGRRRGRRRERREGRGKAGQEGGRGLGRGIGNSGSGRYRKGQEKLYIFKLRFSVISQGLKGCPEGHSV